MPKENRPSVAFTGFDDHEQRELATPEKNLLRAILMNAIADLTRPGEMHRKATEFFTSKEEDYLFSFQSICSYLEIEPQHILYIVGLQAEIPGRKKLEKPAQAQDVLPVPPVKEPTE